MTRLSGRSVQATAMPPSATARTSLAAALEDVATPGVYPSSGQAGYILALLMFACLIAYIDRQVLALLIPPIKAAFNLSDTRIGALQGIALNLCFGLALLPMGALIDRGNRVRLILISGLCWSGFTLLSGLSANYWELFGSRMGVGVAEAGLVPAAFSLIADLYPPRTRATATFVFLGVTLLAARAGISLGGAMIEVLSRAGAVLPFGLSALPIWRLTLMAAATPGLVLAILFLTVSEPSRKSHGHIEAATATALSLWAYLKRNWVTVCCLCGGLVACLVGDEGVALWMPTVLARAYGMAPSRSGEWLGLLLGVGSLTGVVLSGVLTRVLQGGLGALAPLQVLRIGALAAAMTVPALLLVHGPEQTLGVVFIYTIFVYTANGVGPALVLSIAPNHLRGRLYAIWSLTGVIMSIAWPTSIGVFSDHVFHGPRGLLFALCAVIIPCAFASPALLLFIVGPFKRTINIAE